MPYTDNIIALASPSGIGAVALIRISGPDTMAIAASLFQSVSGKDLAQQKTHTIHLGHIVDGDKVLDKVLVSIFKSPNSYTGEDVIEVSCHGSPYIQQQIVQLFLRNGCRTATAGEFTLRAFLNGKMDLSQAEAVADLIASDSEAAHQIAVQQMRGGFSNDINRLREELLNFASLIELELDFSGEDVEFADREKFEHLLVEISEVLKNLIDSFALGNVIKNGIPVAIVGEPNVGKSTLLNALLNEERAIVSDIPGTTRDTIEDQLSIGGINFRFIDTAGIRKTVDVVEEIGIRRTLEKIEQAKVVVYLLDAKNVKGPHSLSEIAAIQKKHPDKALVVAANKVDELSEKEKSALVAILEGIKDAKILLLSAQKGEGLEAFKNTLLEFVNIGSLSGNDTIVTNNRHYNALLKALEEIQKVKEGISNELSSDLLAIDIRQALFHLGEITGEVTTDDLLGNIFSNFCIGK
ncbi:tRNA uridine-5-carboxymethylaminomethyl(34) synthesis GTPase MnmE [Allomuricauda sp. SCSIO 65647]|uniref:tRNA uridine-5-carboxymethylaminomethyl(34) synthesis GTPase MnmE n=1 Tax=Allomuricauda sp. SCSIO 65647 TaxID=2908843 RepID=UPI001F27816C|nr:tRNA uridine-5-carboxymethylaminomethyl(34) synthesis GTPase MnmE [Muricauda sp. SCSIO 65647]UJH67060.1 tRNA uridine-5-carboxymethylaminomethyl(34) synthesis GTPase MnmE [Muricauda sp. SCSIO 65647]